MPFWLARHTRTVPDSHNSYSLSPFQGQKSLVPRRKGKPPTRGLRFSIYLFQKSSKRYLREKRRRQSDRQTSRFPGTATFREDCRHCETKKGRKVTPTRLRNRRGTAPLPRSSFSKQALVCRLRFVGSVATRRPAERTVSETAQPSQ
jgi:hypothetical protein